MTSMTRHGIRLPAGQDLGRLSPCVCNPLRMVTRAVTQLYDDVLRPSGVRVTQFSILATIGRMREANLKQLEDTLAIDQTTLTRSLNLLERDGLIERSPHPDGRVKAMRLASKGHESWRSRGRSGPRRKIRSSANWEGSGGPTRSGGSPICFTSPSRSDDCGENDSTCRRGARREELAPGRRSVTREAEGARAGAARGASDSLGPLTGHR